jgi:hypothetical protein
LSVRYSNSIQGTKQLYYPIQDRDANNAITNQAAIDLWNQKDIIIRNSIFISIDSNQKQNLYGLPTAREMWVKISTLFAAQADEIEQQLITRIFSYRHNPGKDIRYHINCIMNDANKLREMGSPLQDKYIINRMLQTLPESYRHVHSAWTNVPRDEKTIDNLTQRLIAEEGVVASYAVQTRPNP